MADLRSRFIEDYAGGLLNVSRQELATNGEILSQDGFLTDSTIFVEDGVGVKSGLKLGIGLAESVDPTTTNGIVNVRYADRTYTKIRDTKIFATAIASSQAALSEAVSESFGSVEAAIDLIDSTLTGHESQLANLLEGLTNVGDKLDQSDSTRDDYILALLREIKNILDSIGLPGIYIPSEGDTTTQTPTGDIVINLPDLLLPNPTPPESTFSQNVKLGGGALGKLQSGILNTAIGIDSLGDLIAGSNNTALGTNSGSELRDGSNNTYIGNGAKASRTNISNEIIVGSDSTSYIELSKDPYIPSPSDLDITDIDKSDHDLLWKYFYFISDLNYKEDQFKNVIIDPESIRNSEKKWGLQGYVDPQTRAVSKSKFAPISLILLEHIHRTARAELDVLNDFKDDSEILHSQLNSRVNGLADTIASYGSIPLRGIIMWSGLEIPYGWVLCNGQNIIIGGETVSVPDLRDKFIIGAGRKFGVNTKKDTDPIAAQHVHTVTPDFPAMTETMLAPNSVTNWSVGDNSVNISQQSVIGYQDSAFADAPNESEIIVRPLPEVTTSTEGGLGADTYPPYYALAFIMRVL